MVTDRIPKILGEDTSVGFTIAAAKKDNDVFQRVVEAYGLDSPILALVEKRQAAAVADGMGEMDPASLATAAYNRG